MLKSGLKSSALKLRPAAVSARDTALFVLQYDAVWGDFLPHLPSIPAHIGSIYAQQKRTSH